MEWLYASLSVTAVSLCGLLGALVIPIMNHSIYHHLLQFFVALAIGTLCGDALLHLLPHALEGELEAAMQQHVHDEHAENGHHHGGHGAHNIYLWKGLAVLLGLVFFFFTEKFLALWSESRHRIQRNRKVQAHSHVQILNDNTESVGERLCKHKYSSYPYCYEDIKNNKDGHEHVSCKQSDKSVGVNGEPTKGNKDEECPEAQESQRLTIENGKEEEVKTCDRKEGEYTVIVREHEVSHHGHSHAHGHVHSPPDSLSSIVWMVLLGDGLHNFTDGMAIGAAFANNIAGGWSTAVAVFCHEVPHELGDFAVLLKAGMPAKQAILYNLLSSVLCFVGMCIGMVVAANPQATSWLFAVTSGLFLYIALVDMFPELTSTHTAGHSSFCQYTLQGMGLLTGVGVMVLIAYYEENLLTLFT